MLIISPLSSSGKCGFDGGTRPGFLMQNVSVISHFIFNFVYFNNSIFFLQSTEIKIYSFLFFKIPPSLSSIFNAAFDQEATQTLPMQVIKHKCLVFLNTWDTLPPPCRWHPLAVNDAHLTPNPLLMPPFFVIYLSGSYDHIY